MPEHRKFWRLRISLFALLAVFCLSGSALSETPPQGAAEKLRDPNLVIMRAMELDTRVGEPYIDPSLRIEAYRPGELGYYIVQFAGVVRAEWREEVERAGGDFFDYLPNNAFVVRMDEGTLSMVRAMGFIRWTGVFQPAYKIDPELGKRAFKDASRRKTERLWLIVDLFEAENAGASAALLRSMGVEVKTVVDEPGIRRLEVLANPSQVSSIATLTAVRWIEEYGEIEKRNETTKWVIQSNATNQTPVWNLGIHGEGQIIGHIDGKIDIGHCGFRDPGGSPPGPSHRKIIGYRSSSGSGAPYDFHGTHAAGTAAGDQAPVTGSQAYNGMAYSSMISFTDLSDITLSNLSSSFSAASADGARVHTNSWGDDGTTAYTVWARDIDLFSRNNEDNLVLFAVSNLSTLRTPENSKNVLAVGASQQAPNQHLHGSGGKGPTSDGRRKPEIYAPGIGIFSSRVNTLCGFWGASGTSMATPAVAGAAALVRQYFTEGWYPTGSPVAADSMAPSGSLIKALLINSAVDMTGVNEGSRLGNKNYPNNIEGWGRALIENALYFSGQTLRLIVRDVRNSSGLSTGGEAVVPFTVTSSSEPLKVTLAWADPPASVNAGFTPVNNLNLEVTGPSGTYLGNYFNATSGESASGGAADALNNLEVVLIKVPAAGSYIAKVKGTAVQSGTQGYALAITGNVLSGAANQPPVAEANGPYNGTAGTPVNLSSAGSFDPDGTIVGYKWVFGDSTRPSYLQNPAHVYSNPGNYNVTLTVTDNNGATATDFATVTVAP